MFTWNEDRIRYFRIAADRSTYHEALAQLLLPDQSQSLRILDVGCGLGDLACCLARHGCTVTGVDLSEKAITAAKLLAEKNDLHNIYFLTADMQTATVPGDFDTLLFCQFGHMAQAMDITRRHRCRRLIVIAKESTHHVFRAVSARIERNRQIPAETLLQACRSHTYRSVRLTFDQPVRSCEDACAFLALYDPAGNAAPEDVLPRLQKTDDPDFPFCLPQEKQLGIYSLTLEA